MPNDGAWQPVAASSDVTGPGMTRFEHDSLIGFVRRVDGRLEAVSGVCTHQGCKLWFDQSGDRLRCPCHTTSFAPDGHLLTHQLPIAPKPLPKLEVREADGVIEVYGPARAADTAVLTVRFPLTRLGSMGPTRSKTVDYLPRQRFPPQEVIHRPVGNGKIRADHQHHVSSDRARSTARH